MNASLLIEPSFLPRSSDVIKIPDLPAGKATKQQGPDQILCSFSLRLGVLQYVESGVEIEAVFRGQIPCSASFSVLTADNRPHDCRRRFAPQLVLL
jgi:hypothetical protein